MIMVGNYISHIYGYIIENRVERYVGDARIQTEIVNK